MRFHVNGAPHDVDLRGNETLLEVLRDRLGLTGAKLSCGRGECGACTVLMTEDGQAHPVYSCITLAAGCAGTSVTTIEGLGANGLHPLQEAFMAQDAVQCGYCTPGQIMAAAALLSRNPSPDEPAIRTAMSGNLCRCGTYPRIVHAIQEAAQRMKAAT